MGDTYLWLSRIRDAHYDPFKSGGFDSLKPETIAAGDDGGPRCSVGPPRAR